MKKLKPMDLVCILGLFAALATAHLIDRHLLDYPILNVGGEKPLGGSLPVIILMSLLVIAPIIAISLDTRRIFPWIVGLFALLVCALNGYPMANVHLDRSPAMPAIARVTGKYMTKSRTPQPMLQLSVLGDAIPREIRTSHKRYRQTAIGDTLELRLRAGLFGTPWAELE